LDLYPGWPQKQLFNQRHLASNHPLSATEKIFPPPAMSLTKAATTALRQIPRQPALRSSAAVAAQQQRHVSDASISHTQFTSPFHRGTGEERDTTVIPSFGKYKAGSETNNKMFQYFMVGAFGGLSAMGAKNTVQGESIQIYSSYRQC
jgi:ubiquinol-cytochrome c reductase iron-sulfur subunit